MIEALALAAVMQATPCVPARGWMNPVRSFTLNASDPCRGPRGPRGKRGPRGYKGDTGERGPQGATGSRGPRGLRGQVGATGATGPRGERGDTGATGATGPAGPAGPAGVLGYEAVTDTVDTQLAANGFTTLTVNCPTGKFPVGGWYGDLPGGLVPEGSTANLTAPTGWSFVIRNTNGFSAPLVTDYGVICIDVAPV